MLPERGCVLHGFTESAFFDVSSRRSGFVRCVCSLQSVRKVQGPWSWGQKSAHRRARKIKENAVFGSAALYSSICAVTHTSRTGRGASARRRPGAGGTAAPPAPPGASPGACWIVWRGGRGPPRRPVVNGAGRTMEAQQHCPPRSIHAATCSPARAEKHARVTHMHVREAPAHARFIAAAHFPSRAQDSGAQLQYHVHVHVHVAMLRGASSYGRTRSSRVVVDRSGDRHLDL